MSSSASEISISPIPLPELDFPTTFSERLLESIVSSDSQANGLQCWHEASQRQKDGLPLRSLLTAFRHSARVLRDDATLVASCPGKSCPSQYFP